MDRTTAWIYLTAATLTFLSVTIPLIKKAITWLTQRDLIAVSISLALELCSLVLWMLIAAGLFFHWSPMTMIVLAIAFNVCTVLAFRSKPEQAVSRKEITSLVWQLVSGVFILFLFTFFAVARTATAPQPKKPAVTVPAGDPR